MPMAQLKMIYDGHQYNSTMHRDSGEIYLIVKEHGIKESIATYSSLDRTENINNIRDISKITNIAGEKLLALGYTFKWERWQPLNKDTNRISITKSGTPVDPAAQDQAVQDAMHKIKELMK